MNSQNVSIEDLARRGNITSDNWRCALTCQDCRTTWVPESDQCEVLGEYRRQDGSFRDASVISIHERYPGQQEVTAYAE